MKQRWLGSASYVGVFGVALVLRLLVPVTGGGMRGTYGYDSSVYYAAGAALVHGRVPYRDFILLHPPGVALVTGPAALIGRLTGDQIGFAFATILCCSLGAMNAVLVAVVARRLGIGRTASLAGGLFYAVWFASVHAEYQTRLEPLGNFFLLCGLLAFTSISGSWGRRAAVLCGACLGAAVSVKLSYFVPTAVVFGWLLLAEPRNRPAAARLSAGAAAATLAICGPFFVLAPTAMWDMVIAQQAGRNQSNSLRDVLLFKNVPDELGARPVALAIVAAMFVTASLLVLLARQTPVARLPVVLTFAHTGALLAAPSFLIFYLDFLTAPLALCVAAGVHLLLAREPSPARRIGALPGAVVLGAFLVVPAVGLWYGRGSAVRPFPSTQLASAVRDSPCVMSDSPMGLIVLDALSRNLANGCPNWVDVTGRTYAPDMVFETADGERLPRELNLAWQRVLRDYLLSGDAVIIRHAKDSGMSPATWDAIRSGGVLAAEDGEVVYRVKPG